MKYGSSTGGEGRSTGFPHAADSALAMPRPAGGWSAPGLPGRVDRYFNVIAGAVIAVFAIGWIWSIANAHAAAGTAGAPLSGTGTIAAGLTRTDAPTAAYVNDALLDALTRKLRGTSGKLRAVFAPAGTRVPTDSAAGQVALAPLGGGDTVESSPSRPGIWQLIVRAGNAARPVSDLRVIGELPFSAKQRGHIGLYYLGSWPSEHGAKGPAKAPPGKYANPPGFIEVTPQNEDTPVSEHFKLRDFLTHDQQGVWPKYIVLHPELVDKLELVLQDLQEHGINPNGVHVMSGFRTPQYNVGGGDPSGRAGLSRHMYGDAADIFIDNNGDGQMDDLNHDGKVNIGDSRVILAAVDRVEQAHPELVGGAGVYPAESGHGPFIHIDARGYRARWIGSGGG